MMILLILLTYHAIQPVALECVSTFEGSRCINIHIEDFLDEFYRNLPINLTCSEDYYLTIENSVVSDMEYLPELSVNLTRITIKSSFLKTVSPNAFEEHQNLLELNLAGNKLRNLMFIQDLPVSLMKLDLSKNNIGYIDNVFLNFKNLDYLDLSYNRIGILDLSAISNINNVNLYKNEINKIIPAGDPCSINRVKLSRNLITSFNETALKCTFQNLDLSYNNLTILEISNEKSLYNLSGNNLKSIKSSFNEISVFQSVDLSNQMDDIKLKWKILVTEMLDMKNNKISYLSNDTFDLRSVIDREDCHTNFDMSNCSIVDITEYYFSNLKIPSLKLSYNTISTLRSNVFYKSHIDRLDLSFSKLKLIKNQAFTFANMKLLNLSHNEIQIVKNIFDESQIHEIDLSYNKVQSVFSHSFENTFGIRHLKLSHCLIERIEAEAFVGLKELINLDLSYNKLLIIEATTFSNLPTRSINLQGNNITSLRGKAFNNLSNMIEINLFGNGIKNLETNTFFDLPRVKSIDLRNNHISSIPRNLFLQIPSLEEVLLAGNNITHMNPISNKIKIKYLSISFDGILKPRRLSNVNLRSLFIEDSEIKVLKSHSFDGLYNLNELSFVSSNVYFIEPGALNHLYRLEYLDAQNLFKFTKHIEKNTFKDLKSLEVLHLSSLSLENLDSYCFMGLESLRTLLLDANSLVEIKKNTFTGLKSLKYLDLSKNNIELISNEAFIELDQLEELYLNFNNIMNIEMNLPQLKFLSLEHNNISELSTGAFVSVGNLEKLLLNHNNLEQIPVGVFQHLSNLKLLNLSYNGIKIIKNGELSNLINLTVLDLSYNEIVKLENESVFFSLRSMNELYLDNNHLKNLDFKKLVRNLPNLIYVGISLNKWKCDTLSKIIDDLNGDSVNYQPNIPDFDDDNINGISCIDICKFVYCTPEEDGIFHYY